MCLSSRKTKKEMDKWLKSQPDNIIAYKEVVKRSPLINGKTQYHLAPLCFGNVTKKYKRKNRIKAERPFINVANSNRRPYEPYFHLWLEKYEIPSAFKRYRAIVKCLVPKHLITAVGTNLKYIGYKTINTPCIVAKGFDIVSNHHTYKKYFDEE